MHRVKKHSQTSLYQSTGAVQFAMQNLLYQKN